MLDAGTVTTKKLYYDDPYMKSFSGTVLSFEKNDVVLDQTAFFPEEGGQTCDHGFLEDFRVTDVQIRDGKIHHYLDLSQSDEEKAAETFRIGGKVHGRIDWEERYSNMQMHSGEHIFSGLVYRKFGYDNIGFHLSPHEMTLDFGGPIPESDLYEIETQANQAVFENVKTKIVFPSKEERERMEYRSKLDLEGEVRIVVFPGYDACACCAPHVRSTAEIGLIKVVSMQNWKSGVRISLVCGRRAFEMLRREHEIVRKTANFLSAAPDEVYDLTVRAKNDNVELKSSVKNLGRRLLQAEAEGIPEETDDALIFEEGIESKAARDAVNFMMKRHPGYSAVFLGSDQEGWNYIIGSPKKNCRDMSETLRQKFGARGGGKPEMVQGSVHAKKKEIKALFHTCKTENDPV